MNGRTVVVGAVLGIVAMATAAIMFISGDASMERLGLLFGLLGPTLIGLLALLRSDAAAKSTDATSGIAEALNGNFDARVRNAVRHVAGEGTDSIGAPMAAESISLADHDVITKPTKPG